MIEYENVAHGSASFPVGIHDTECTDGFRLYPHIHRELELLVLTKGSGIIYIDGKEYFLKMGDGVFVNSCQLHLGVRADNEPCKFFAVVFAPEFIGGLGGDIIEEKYVFPVTNKKISLPTFLSRETQWQRLDFLVVTPKNPDFMRFSGKEKMTTICIKIVVIFWCG